MTDDLLTAASATNGDMVGNILASAQKVANSGLLGKLSSTSATLTFHGDGSTWGGPLPVGIPTPAGWGVNPPPAWWKPALAAIRARPDLMAAIFAAAPGAVQPAPGTKIANVTVLDESGKVIGATGAKVVSRSGTIVARPVASMSDYSAAGPPELPADNVQYLGGGFVIPPPATTPPAVTKNSNMVMIALAVGLALAVMK